MALREWYSRQRNTLRGFATVELPSGLIIWDVSVHRRDGRTSASLAARCQGDIIRAKGR
jgi:hypothetical protein